MVPTAPTALAIAVLICLGSAGCAHRTRLPEPGAWAVAGEEPPATLPRSAQLVHQVEMRLPLRSFVFTSYTLWVPERGWILVASTPMGVDLFQLAWTPAGARAEVLFPPLRPIFRGEPLARDLHLALVDRCAPGEGEVGEVPGATVRRCPREGGTTLEVRSDGARTTKRLLDRRGRERAVVVLSEPLPGQPLVHRSVDVASRAHRYTLRLRLQDATFDVEYDPNLFDEAPSPR